MEIPLKNLAGKLSRSALEKLYNAQVWSQSKLMPPPPGGTLPPVWMTTGKPPYGLLARGGALSDDALLLAYSKGVFPIHDNGSVNWWSSNPRMVLYPEKMVYGKKIRRQLKPGRFTVSFDTAFEDIVLGCSEREKTWLIPERINIALSLHAKGLAHSVEVWDADGELVGGEFGVDLGGVFLSESAFYRTSYASAVSCIYLNCYLQHWGYLLNDIGSYSEHWIKFGFESMPRGKYLRLLEKAGPGNKEKGAWSIDEGLDVYNWIPSRPGSQVAGALASPVSLSGRHEKRGGS